MTSLPFDDFLKSLVEEQDRREKYRTVIESIDEVRKASPGEAQPSLLFLSPSENNPECGEAEADSEKFWEVRDQDGKWQGPFATKALFTIPWFTGQTAVRIAGTNRQNPARLFPEILAEFSTPKTGIHGKRKCPDCAKYLISTTYEGVSVHSCPHCGGKFVPEAGVMRIICRREIKPSPYLLEKAHQWKTEHKVNPILQKRWIKEASGDCRDDQICPPCPLCERGMFRRIFSYQYFIGIAQCGTCKWIWFKGDELEILQILIEDAGY